MASVNNSSPIHPFFTVPDLSADGDFEVLGVNVHHGTMPTGNPFFLGAAPNPNFGDDGDNATARLDISGQDTDMQDFIDGNDNPIIYPGGGHSGGGGGGLIPPSGGGNPNPVQLDSDAGTGRGSDFGGLNTDGPLGDKSDSDNEAGNDHAGHWKDGADIFDSDAISPVWWVDNWTDPYYTYGDGLDHYSDEDGLYGGGTDQFQVDGGDSVVTVVADGDQDSGVLSFDGNGGDWRSDQDLPGGNPDGMFDGGFGDSTRNKGFGDPNTCRLSLDTQALFNLELLEKSYLTLQGLGSPTIKTLLGINNDLTTVQKLLEAIGALGLDDPIPLIMLGIDALKEKLTEPITNKLEEIYQEQVDGWLKAIKQAYWTLSRTSWNLLFDNQLGPNGPGCLDSACAQVFAELNGGFVPQICISSTRGDGSGLPIPVRKTPVLIPISSIGIINQGVSYMSAGNSILPEIISHITKPL